MLPSKKTDKKYDFYWVWKEEKGTITLSGTEAQGSVSEHVV